MSPVGLQTKNNYAGESQEQFTQPDWLVVRQLLASKDMGTEAEKWPLLGAFTQEQLVMT